MMTANTREVGIKILLVGPVPPPFGGIPAYVKSLNDARIDGVEFSLFNTAFPEWVAPFHREGRRSYQSIFEISLWVGLKKVFFVVFSFLKLIKDIFVLRPQIVHVFTCSYWGYWRNWIYILIAKLLQKKTVFHLLGAIDLFYAEVNNLQRFFLRESLNSADCYLLQSPELEKWAKQYSHKMVVGLWNGIDFGKIPPKSSLPPEWISSFSGRVGVSIGNLSINKGSAKILDALSQLRKQNTTVGWVFIGRGDLEHFKNLAEQKGLTEQVYFSGEIDEFLKWQYLLHANFFCLPSDAEGQPISIIEAMACKLTVISTYVGSIPEMISDGSSGILINHDDNAALMNSILYLDQNPQLCESMGQKAMEICLSRHNINDLYKKLHEIYLRISTASF
ncbi:MAG: glycosyltransferase family 4 protein [Planctomycetes bacterium]|nr:glycosyltransferase family 4 protein [Planctomycetota bacterium]MBI5965722.1 glycosyltransferase family 4 protein [Chloroflexota bacterium]